MAAEEGGLGFAIDRGGTFTDVFVVYPNGEERTLKLLSEDANYLDAPTEAIRCVLNEYTGQSIQRGEKIPTENISWIRMGTTVATNALLERKGERTALLITKGFKDLLYIGNQSRPKIFDFDIKIPDPLYEVVVEVDERVVLDDPTCGMQLATSENVVVTENGRKIIVERAISVDEVERILVDVRKSGIESLAVLFINSYLYPAHENAVDQVAQKLNFRHISLSSSVIPMIKAVPRGFTTCADAYLTPVIQKYIQGFCSGFVDNLESVELEFMQSDGGLCPVDNFIGSRAILSGPAGGVVGVSLTAYNDECREEQSQGAPPPVIGFDMGGTSTDVSRYAGAFTHVVESVTAGVTIQAPQLDISTVAAGGGSRLFFLNGLFVVGPESAGSTPGPVCYRKPGGALTITDANLVLGRIQPDFFPHIFGPTEDQPLDKDASMAAFDALTDDINAHLATDASAKRNRLSVQDVALGFVRVANEAMCRPIRNLTESKGYDTFAHVLACFGGAGGQHACSIARSLGMKQVKVHRYAGILSAYGLGLADVVAERQEPFMKTLNSDTFAEIETRFAALGEKCRDALLLGGSRASFSANDVRLERILHMRYERTDCALMCSTAEMSAWRRDDEVPDADDFRRVFLDKYRREFGFTIPDRGVVVDDIRIRAFARRKSTVSTGSANKNQTDEANPMPLPKVVTKCTFEDSNDDALEMDTNVYLWSELPARSHISGPGIIIEKNCTVVVEPHCEARLTANGDLEIELLSGGGRSGGDGAADEKVDPIQLSVFSHRFMSIAEQMGSALQRSAISTNIKERLDFSCALFGPDGGLVANAPHIPVHLGGMQATVMYQIQHFGADGFREGDVILCNHPKAGGSHLPDLTVITPVFFSAGKRKTPDFFVANRGHHSDIGGLVPGSMPPHSHSLKEEGATFVAFKIVENGVFREQQLIEQLKAPGRVPGCSGSRNLRDNLADLNAQIAANQKGILLLNELVDGYGIDMVKRYMGHIQYNAEQAVRKLLIDTAERSVRDRGTSALSAEDYMDDGTLIRLCVGIDAETGNATFDFTGTGLQVYSSCNTPPAVCMAAVIYCLRCLIGTDIPLNQGCLKPIKIVVPPGTILSPTDDAAVVGGNVLTSQRLCDVILLAFGAVAASQGCMNNVTFGDDRMGGYYETVAGGAGAGPTFHGCHGVHTHMTNTRITDPEIMELRFSLRDGSGGLGHFRGGDGVHRYLQFRRALQLSVLTERRVFAPYGLMGGRPGQRGANVLYRHANGTRVNLGSKNSVRVEPGDIFELETPGGGGYGAADDQ